MTSYSNATKKIYTQYISILNENVFLKFLGFLKINVAKEFFFRKPLLLCLLNLVFIKTNDRSEYSKNMSFLFVREEALKRILLLTFYNTNKIFCFSLCLKQTRKNEFDSHQ